MNAKRYNVMLERMEGGWVMLTHRNRHEWSKRTAERHAEDVRAKWVDAKLRLYRDVKVVEAN